MLAVIECTGMRSGELRVLMWEDLKLDEKTIYIRQAAKKSYEKIKDIRIGPKSSEYVGPTKSKYGVRKLKLSSVVIKALKEWRKTLDGMPKAMKESKFIFPSQSGGFTTESSFSCLMKRFVKRAQIDMIS